MILELILAAGSLSVHLPAGAEVAGTDITLGEIAEISGDESLVAAASRLSLGYTPAPGFSRLLVAERVKARITEYFPETKLTFSGEPKCRVTPLIEKVPAASISAVASRDLRTIFEGIDAEISLHGTIGDLTIPKGVGPAKLVAVLQRRDQRPGVWSVPVQVLVDDAVYQTVWTRWTVGLWTTRRVLKRAVRRGEALSAADFELERVQLTDGNFGEAIDVDIIEGATARFDLALGSMINARDIERPRVAKRGDLSWLEVRRGSICARMPVYLLDGGRIGDVVKVRSVDMDRMREMVATIVSKDLVRISL